MVVDSSALGSTKRLRLIGSKIGASDNAVRDSISEYQLPDEADSSAGIKILDGFSFNPLSELVNCHQHMGEAASACS